MVDISRHIDFLGPSGKTLSVSERSGLQVGAWTVAMWVVVYYNTTTVAQHGKYCVFSRVLTRVCMSWCDIASEET